MKNSLRFVAKIKKKIESGKQSERIYLTIVILFLCIILAVNFAKVRCFFSFSKDQKKTASLLGVVMSAALVTKSLCMRKRAWMKVRRERVHSKESKEIASNSCKE